MVSLWVSMSMQPLHAWSRSMRMNKCSSDTPTCNHGVLADVQEHAVTLPGREAHKHILLMVHGCDQQRVWLLTTAALVHLWSQAKETQRGRNAKGWRCKAVGSRKGVVSRKGDVKGWRR
eukprot:1160277-Pelagomonas_calceolata.AAC.22